MNRLYQLLLLVTILLTNNVWAQKVQAEFDYATFYNSKSGSYIETYLWFNGDSLTYKLTEDSTLIALMEVTMLFKNADKIKEFRKFKITSAELPDTTTIFENIVNKQRISLPNGIYNFDIIIKYMYGGDTIAPYRATDLISVNFPENEISLGGIELLEKYTISKNKNIFMKGDYECIPYASDIYTEDTDYLKVYTELYNAAKAIGPLESFYFLFHIEQVNTGKPIKGFSYFEKQKAYNLNSVYKELRIKNLPSGHYFLTVEIQDSLNRSLLSSKKYFYKKGQQKTAAIEDFSSIDITNTFVDKINPSNLSFFIKSLRPISDDEEKFFIDSVLTNAKVQTRLQFFLNFWASRNEVNPAANWQTYKESVDAVQEEFSFDNVEGYETDMGRTRLAYGIPNEISQQKLKDGEQVEVWYYYKLWDQSNIKFTFNSKKLAELIDTNLIWEKRAMLENHESVEDSQVDSANEQPKNE